MKITSSGRPIGYSGIGGAITSRPVLNPEPASPLKNEAGRTTQYGPGVRLLVEKGAVKAPLLSVLAGTGRTMMPEGVGRHGPLSTAIIPDTLGLYPVPAATILVPGVPLFGVRVKLPRAA